MRVGFPIVDTYSALLAAFAIQSAYIQRERDPERRGQFIDMSMLDASLVMMAFGGQSAGDLGHRAQADGHVIVACRKQQPTHFPRTQSYEGDGAP